MPDTTHECPAPRCTAWLPRSQLACARHWGMLPRHLRRAVTDAWARRATDGLTPHLAARQAAVEWWEQNA
jgi:hypothetical protein